MTVSVCVLLKYDAELEQDRESDYRLANDKQSIEIIKRKTPRGARRPQK